MRGGQQKYLIFKYLEIVYEQLDITLRRVTSVLSTLFKRFQIATIFKEVSTLPTDSTLPCLREYSWSQAFLTSTRSFPYITVSSTVFQ
jgi:hypothetical protein